MQIKNISMNLKYYILNTLFNIHLGFIGATYVVYFYESGISKLTTNILLSIFIFEIPSGIIADKFGEKAILLVSGITLVISMSFFLLGNSFYIFVVAQFLWGISFFSVSGALDSWFVNRVKNRNNLPLFFAQANTINNSLKIISGFIGGILSQVSLKIPWVMSLIFSLLYFISVCIFIEPQDITIKTKLTLKRKLFEFKCGYIDSINQFKANKNLEKIVLLNSTVAFVISPIFIFWSPYLKELSGNKIWILGNIWLIINLSNFIGNLIVEKKSIIRENYFLTLKIVYLILSVSIIIGVLIGNFISVLIAFIIFEIGLGIVQPLEKVLTNNFIEDSNRASLLSFDSMIQKIFNFGSLIIMGIISEYYSIKITWLFHSFMMILIYYQIKLMEKV